MPELAHSTPPPLPAKPLTADKVLELELKQRRKFQGRGAKVGIGCKGIDEYVLGGGIERGIVVGISADFGGGDGGVEGRLISLHLLASILLSYSGKTSRSSPKPIATIIDTTGTFPISLLAQVLSSRLGANSSNEELTRLMEMVAISRVFDLEGLWEVLGELSFTNNPPTPTKAAVERKETVEVTEIQDSESEGFGSPDSFISDFFKEEEDAGTEILIIDNLTHILTSLLQQKEKSSAHTLISSLSIHLHNLTRTHNVLTILHNTLLPIQSSSKPQPPNSNQHQTQNNNQPLFHLTSPSIFTTSFKPSLGRIFTQFPNLHILISSLPKTRRDAEVLYGSESRNGNGERVERVCVFEVVSDECPYTPFPGNVDGEGKGKGKEGEMKEGGKGKFARREQRWCAFESGGDGVGIVDVDLGFGKKGNGGGEGGSVSASDVGSVAKIHGFGGRRV